MESCKWGVESKLVRSVWIGCRFLRGMPCITVSPALSLWAGRGSDSNPLSSAPRAEGPRRSAPTLSYIHELASVETSSMFQMQQLLQKHEVFLAFTEAFLKTVVCKERV